MNLCSTNLTELSDNEARYEADIQRGRTWSICTTMSLDDWLPCTGIKEGYCHTEYFIHWLQNYLILLSTSMVMNGPMVIVMIMFSFTYKRRLRC